MSDQQARGEAGDADDATMADLAELLGSPALGADERNAVLDLTRVVAHTVQRRFGPLAAYSLGLAAGAAGTVDRHASGTDARQASGTDARTASGTDARTAALREAISRLEDRAAGESSGEES